MMNLNNHSASINNILNRWGFITHIRSNQWKLFWRLLIRYYQVPSYMPKKVVQEFKNYWEVANN